MTGLPRTLVVVALRAESAGVFEAAGMSGDEIESYIRTATVWERPSWPLGDWHAREQNLRDHVVREFFEESASERSAVPPMPKVVSRVPAV